MILNFYSILSRGSNTTILICSIPNIIICFISRISKIVIAFSSGMILDFYVNFNIPLKTTIFIVLIPNSYILKIIGAST